MTVITVPAAAMLPVAWAASAAQRVLPFHVPAEYEGVLICYHDTRYDDSLARAEFGIQPRPLEETLRDAVRWLNEAGHVTARQAGAAAAS